jgi:hypothetical protein
MEASFFVLIAGVLLSLYDQAFGVRPNQPGKGQLRRPVRFALLERRCTIAGSGLALLAAVLAALGY